MTARRLLASLLLIAGWTQTLATTVVDLGLEAMLQRADRIVYGRVREVTSGRDADDGNVRTRVVVEVERDLSPSADPDEELVLSFLGGGADGTTLEVEGVPRLEVGEHVLVLAYDDPDGRMASPIVGVWQGLWRLGPEGLSDQRGRLLTPGERGLAATGEGGDLGRTLQAIEAWATGDGAIVAPPDADADRPERAGPDDAAEEPSDEQAPAEERAADELPTDVPAEEAEKEAPDEAADAPASQAGAEDPGDEDEIRLALRPPEDDALRSTFERAADAWRDAGAPLRLSWDDAADDVVRTSPRDVLGPDALSLVLRRAEESGREILIREDVAATAVGVAAYELAGLAGAPRADTGLLSGRLADDGSARPAAGDADALLAARAGPRGDLDGDGDVDFHDLALLAEAFGTTGARLAADLDDSGRVDEEDLAIMREAYRFLPPSPDPPPGRTAAD